ncbi:hypothetical protein BJY16_007622 [Actinoplanes octamycinicus]|uniref:Alpha-L-arabinofuranosidase B arabinose-binding domain-containing protein n=1 Tax=Actinoplanes octamycinicus TaxID=135948 RepID=A0A7W7H536_9ACTN|nr:AbfB domain-containing protein [Actinoplanes octamycinicus]MBB4744163.1 hypothetical protein [Actinoplanes octamycinicus]GIE56881.1 hypothetical protein Aoc01nite_22830 [Actinoplanes octamycinicus]
MTIYGRGGVDVQDRRRLHPGVLALVAVAGVIVVAALGYLMFRSPPRAPQSPAAASLPAAPVASPPAPSESPSPAAPTGVTAGSWLVTPAGDKDDFLVADGEYAAMSDEPAPLTVVAGLADDACVSFRNESGEYLRHFDYRLRFDRADDADDADLFRKDATFCPEDDQPAGTFRLRSKNYPDYFLHRRDDDSLHIDKPDDDADDFVEETSFSLRSPADS